MSSLPEGSVREPPCIVLDTNVVLDWFYFRDARCETLADAVMRHRVRWIASPPMHDEIEHVLERGSLGTRWPDGSDAVRRGWQRWATMVRVTTSESPLAMRCSDADDQKFIDLALAAGAVALLSADNAVLRLARRAAAFGLVITTVGGWQMPGASPAMHPEVVGFPCSNPRAAFRTRT